MSKTSIVFYFCLFFAISTAAIDNPVATSAENTINATVQAEVIANQVGLENDAQNTTFLDESIQHFLNDVVNDWADQMLIDFIGSSMKQFEMIISTNGFSFPTTGGKLIHYDEGFVNAPYSGFHSGNVDSSNQQDVEKKRMIEYIMQSMISQLINEIQDKNEDSFTENGESDNIDDADVILESLRKRYEGALEHDEESDDNFSDTDDDDEEFIEEVEETGEKKHEGIGNFFVKRMKFWNHIDFEENEENSETYEEL